MQIQIHWLSNLPHEALDYSVDCAWCGPVEVDDAEPDLDALS